jgi:hypothetical protein
MTQAAPAWTKIPTKSPQPALGKAARAKKTGSTASAPAGGPRGDGIGGWHTGGRAAPAAELTCLSSLRPAFQASHQVSPRTVPGLLALQLLLLHVLLVVPRVVPIRLPTGRH